jgi:DNA-binding HxlR family transcriptional regulator
VLDNPQLEKARELLAGASVHRLCPDESRGFEISAEAMDERRTRQNLLAQLTNRWSALILAALVTGPYRFHELTAALPGISEKMLSQNLRMLIRAGLIEREVGGGSRFQVSYSLSELGADLAVRLCGLIRWICDHTDELAANRPPRP